MLAAIANPAPAAKLPSADGAGAPVRRRNTPSTYDRNYGIFFREVHEASDARIGRRLEIVKAGVVALVFSTACSPVCRLELRFASSTPLVPALFQLTGKKTCPPGPVGTAAPIAPAALAAAGARSDDAEWQEVSIEPPGLRVVTAFRGSRCRVTVTGFYDSNGDGKVNSGDLQATSSAIDVFDNGIFRGNLTVGPVLRMTAVP